MTFKQGSSRGAASRGSDFLKKRTSAIILSIFRSLLCLSSRGLAGVLPPVGQSFDKMHFLENFVNLAEMFCAFQAGV